jgi:hypothetical protein
MEPTKYSFYDTDDGMNVTRDILWSFILRMHIRCPAGLHHYSLVITPSRLSNLPIENNEISF